MSLRREREALERRRSRAYELALAAGAAVVGGALLSALALVLYSLLPAGRAPEPADLQPGLLARYDGLTRVDPRIDFDALDHARVEWTGYLRVPIDGRYVFSVAGPARLELAGRPVTGAAQLAAGHHSLRLVFAGSRAECRLSWESEARPREVVPDHALFHVEDKRGARN